MIPQRGDLVRMNLALVVEELGQPGRLYTLEFISNRLEIVTIKELGYEWVGIVAETYPLTNFTAHCNLRGFDKHIVDMVGMLKLDWSSVIVGNRFIYTPSKFLLVEQLNTK